MMKFKPLGNRILVKRLKAQTTKGGILLPDSAQEKPRQGEVVAIGPGKLEKNGTIKPMELRVSDQVLFSSFAGTEVKAADGEEILIMSEEDVLAVIE
jgi:chaperonin GroES